MIIRIQNRLSREQAHAKQMNKNPFVFNYCTSDTAILINGCSHYGHAWVISVAMTIIIYDDTQDADTHSTLYKNLSKLLHTHKYKK